MHSESALGRFAPLGILAIGGAGALLLGTSRPELEARAQVAPPPLTTVETAHFEPIDVTVSSFGTVAPRSEIDLVAEISGRVVAMSPDLVAGGAFAQGETLVELDAVESRVELERMEALLHRAEIAERQMRVKLDRARALLDGSVASRAQQEDAEFALELAGARAREARASREAARRMLRHTIVAAPFAGRVRSERVEAGQFVKRGESLARIFASDALEVRLPLADSQLAVLELPDPGGLIAEEVEIPVILRAHYAGRERTWHARVVRIEAEIASSSRMIYAVAQIDDTAPTPPIGLFVEAEIDGIRFESVAALPRSALHDGNRVLVIDPQKRVRERSIGVARVEDERVLVADGLREGERVCISTPPPPVGAQVRVVEPSPGTAGGTSLASVRGQSPL